MDNKGTLYLIPMLLGDAKPHDVLPQAITQLITKIKYYIVENERTTRRYLRKLDPKFDIDHTTFFVLNKHTKSSEVNAFLNPAIDGENIGIISESGCPAIADPGAKVVELAHKRNITVKPTVGPSSLFLALMASGLNGQNFAFNGYLPIKSDERKISIKRLEELATKNQQAQLFIETPFRNKPLFDDIIAACFPTTLLCIATDITLENETIKTKTIAEWQKMVPDFHKRPTVFILGTVT